MSLTREQVLFADLAKAMKKTVARQANGKSLRCQEPSTSSLLTRAFARIRLRLRDPTDDQSRQQVEEESKICSPGKTGATDGARGLQGGAFQSLCASERDKSPGHCTNWHTQEVEHAGYKRAVISRNPPLIDEDGYSIDSDDDDQHVQDAVAAAAEADPYSSIHLERM